MGVNQLAYDNNKLRDKKRMEAARQRFFGDKETARDTYSGEVLHRSTKAAVNKYGDAKYTTHASAVDHTIPVERARPTLERLGLSEEEMKRALNGKRNLRVISRQLNSQKGDRFDFELLFDRRVKLPPHAKARMVGETVTAGAEVVGKTAAILAEKHGGQLVRTAGGAVARAAAKVGSEFTSGAVDTLRAGAIPLMVEGVRNLCLVAQGEKDFETAAKEMGKLTVEVAAAGGTVQVLSSGVKSALESSSNSVLKGLANSNQVTQVITIALVVKDSVVRYVNGEIDGEQFFREIGEKGVGLVSGMMGAAIGQALIPIPVVGATIGSMIISCACTEIYRAYQSLGEHEKRLARVSALAAEALAEMERQRTLLRQIVADHFARWDGQVQLGFDELYSATLKNDVEGIAQGLDWVLQVVGGNVKFKTLGEFDQVFLAPNARLKL
jgi:hypothetical protein